MKGNQPNKHAMKTLTWKDFEKFNPCYDPAERYGEWEGTTIDLLNHTQIPNEHKIWAVTREGIVSDKTLRLMAVAFAREVQHLMNDERSLKALDVAEAFALGKATREELEKAGSEAWSAEWGSVSAWVGAARDAARAAANAEATGAAYAAAKAEAEAEATGAAYAAAKAEAEADVMDKTWDEAWDEARRKQIQIAIEIIKKHEQ